jgi:hypothetical protein
VTVLAWGSIPEAPFTNVNRSHYVCIVTEQPARLFGEFADIFFVLLAPDADPVQHLHTLAHIGGLCHDAELLAGLREANTPDGAVRLLRHAVERSKHIPGSGIRERRFIVLELESEEEAVRMRDVLTTAFQGEVVLLEAESDMFEMMRLLVAVPRSRHLLVQTLQLSDAAMLRAILEEQRRLFPDVLCRLHVFLPEAAQRLQSLSSRSEAG